MNDSQDVFEYAGWIKLDSSQFVVHLPTLDWEDTVEFHGTVDTSGRVEIVFHRTGVPDELKGRQWTRISLVLPSEAKGCCVVLRRAPSKELYRYDEEEKRGSAGNKRG